MNAQSGGKLMAVDVKSNGSTFEAGTPKALFDSGYVNQPHFPFHSYVVSADGQRFLIPRPVANVTEDTTLSPVIVVMNWLEGVKR